MPYEKTYDLLDLAIKMQSSREGVSLNDICTAFNVSRRTAERMRNMIKVKFPQIEENITEKGVKRWSIPQGTLRDFTQFSAEEVSLLESAKELFRQNNMMEKLNILERLTDKIKSNIKSNVMRRLEPDIDALMEAEGYVCRPGPRPNTDTKNTSAVRDAILECHKIRIEYQKKSKEIKEYVLEPLGFLYGERNHYLIAKHDGSQPRCFIVNGIKSVEILPESFTADPNFSLKDFAKESFGAYHEKPFDVEWLFDSAVADEAEQYVFHPKQTLRRNPDGSLTVKFRAGGRLEMDWHLYTWGNHVKVVKPENWRDFLERKR